MEHTRSIPEPVTAESVLLEMSGGVAHLTLNRPDQANALDLPTAQAFARAVEAIAASPETRVVVITGNGPRFCAGGDVSSFGTAADRPAYIRELADVLDSAVQRLVALSRPVIAGVQGAVAGGGLGVMLSADVIVAARGTKFVSAYAGIGLTPDIGLSWLLPRAVGHVRAMDLLLTGRVIDADTALTWGLVTEVVDGDAADRARTIGQRIAGGVPEALGEAKRLAQAGWTSTRAEAGAEEARTIAERVVSDEAHPLIERFLNAGA